MDLKNIKVLMFRCHIDPMIGGKSQNAFHMPSMKAETEITPVGCVITLLQEKEVVQNPISKVKEWTGRFLRRRHLVPYANVQSIELEPIYLDAVKAIIPEKIEITTQEGEPEKRGPGRPPKEKEI